jgi:photosystem II stability/assembly factor-like uncharacterized protein
MITVVFAVAAAAHQPHIAVVDVTAAPDGRRWAIVRTDDASQLMRSDDWGAHWTFIGGAPTDDTLTALAFAGGRVVAATDDGTLWVGADDGSWAAEPLPGAPIAIHGLDARDDELIVATDAGVYYGGIDDIAAMSVLSPELMFLKVRFGLDAGVVAATPGLVFASATGPADLALTADLEDGPMARDVAVGPEFTFAGTNRDVQRWDGALWDKCAPLPLTVQTGDAIAEAWLVRAAADGRVYVATGHEALFYSDDDCFTWSQADPGDRPDAVGQGDEDGAQSFTGLVFDGDEWLLAGFDGMLLTADAGLEWARPKLLPANYSRGVALAPWPQALRLYTGEYGGGAAWTDDGGLTWGGSAVGLSGGYTNDLVAEPYAAETGRAWLVSDLGVYRTDDFGESWKNVTIAMVNERELRVADDRVYVFGGDLDGLTPPDVQSTEDHGGTWNDLAEFKGAGIQLAPGAAVVDLLDGVQLGGKAYVVALMNDPATVLSKHGSEHWQVMATPEGVGVGLAAWPSDAPTRLVVATSAGIQFTGDAGDPWLQPAIPPDGHPRRLAMADDDTLVLATRGGRTFTSDDGGDTWTPAGGGFPAAVDELLPAPDFATNRFVVAGTTDGAWWSDDAAATWHPYPRYERFEANTYHLSCLDSDGGNCAPYDDRTDGLGGGLTLTVSDTLRFSFQGTAFHLLGDSGAIIATVDGTALEGDASDVFDGLDERWHDVAVRTTLQNGISVDAVETWGAGDPAPAVRIAGPDTGCCRHGSADRGWVVLAALLPLLRRRLSRDPAPSPPSPPPPRLPRG